MHSSEGTEGKNNKMGIVVLIGLNFGDLVCSSNSPGALYGVSVTSVRDRLTVPVYVFALGYGLLLMGLIADVVPTKPWPGDFYQVPASFSHL